MTTPIDIMAWANNAHIDYTAGRNQAGSRAVTTALRSKPGEAKSSIIETVLLENLEDRLFAGQTGAQDMPELHGSSYVHFSPNRTIAVISENASQRDAMDFRGFLVPKKDGTSDYTMPDLLSLERKLYAAGCKLVILFLDEMMGADHLTQKVLTDVCLNGRLGKYCLSPDTWVIAAYNRQQDGAGVNRPLSILQNRINTIDVFMPVERWATYAGQTLGLPPLMIGFAKQFPSKISIDQPPRDGAFPSWRSYTYAAQWLQGYKDSLGETDPMSLPLGKGHEYAQSKVMGFIGESLTTTLIAYAKVVNELPSKEEILADPEGCKLPSENRLDAAFAVAQMCVYYAEAENADSFWAYIMRLPKELQVASARDLLMKGGGALLNSPLLVKWISQNKALIRTSLT